MRMRPARWLMLLVSSVYSALLLAQFDQDTYDFTVPDCADVVSICSNYSAQDFNDYDFVIDGSAITSARVACNQDTLTTYDLNVLTGIGYAGPYDVNIWMVDGTNTTGTFTNPNELIIIMNFADPAGGWSYSALTNRISGGNSASFYSDMEVINTGAAVTETMTKIIDLNGGGSSFEFSEGTHTIQAFDGATLLDEATVVVNCPQAPTFESFDVFIPTSITVCPDLGALSGPVADVTLTPEPMFVDITLGDNDCFDIQPLGVGVDTVRISYCDAANNCSQVDYVFNSELGTPITTSTVYDTVSAPGSTVTYCIDTLDLPGTVVSVNDVCATGDETYVSFILTEETVCLKYRGLVSGGTDTSCVVVCDNLGFCDTTIVIVTTVEPNEYPDLDVTYTIEEGTVSSHVVDVSSFQEALDGISNTCESLSGTFVGFNPQPSNYSVDFAGLLPGTERACIDVIDISGRRQRTNITVTVTSRAAARDTIRIRNGDTQVWCFGPYELTGPPVFMEDQCVAATQHVRLGLTADVTCQEITATSLGIQDLCMTLCDDSGICDRINLVVEVLPNNDDRLPMAEDDYFITDPTIMNELPALANDESLSPITFQVIVTAPTRGNASFSPSGMLNYQVTGSCAQDSLIYEICNDFGCDQATVILDNNCDGTLTPPNPIVRSGFSPNGDGINDQFVISNIEFYPNATLKIYNRWGSRVLEVQGYSNDWEGTFDGAPLPDGTYYYIADLKTEGMEPLAGYVQVNR